MDYRILDEALAYLNDEPCENRLIYESLQDEFNLDLVLAVSERSLMEDISGIVLESEDIIYLNEGVKETVMNYVQKIVLGIQKAWDKFINLFSQKELDYLKNKVKPLIDKSPNLNFTINNYKSYDFEKMKDIEIVTFNYEEMKDNLSSVNDFLQSAYNGKLDINNSKNVKEALMKYMNYKVVDHYEVGQKELTDIYTFAAEKYFTYRDEVKKDIENLNNSNENIKNMVNQVMDAENQQNTTNESYWFDTDMYFHEEEEPKQTYTDTSNNKTDPDNKEQNEKRKSVTKGVTVYMTGSTKILSAKMSILSRAKRETFMTLNHFYNSKKNNNTAVEDNEQGANTNTTAKVDTDIKKK